MWSTGIKKTEDRGPKTGLRSGFTLVEVMVAVAILAFGIVNLYRAFFISADAAAMAADRLAVQEWAERKIWDEEDEFRKTGQIDSSYDSGSFKAGARTFNWTKSLGDVPWNTNETDETEREFLNQDIKSLVLNITWQSSGHERGMIFGEYLRL